MLGAHTGWVILLSSLFFQLYVWLGAVYYLTWRCLLSGRIMQFHSLEEDLSRLGEVRRLTPLRNMSRAEPHKAKDGGKSSIRVLR